MSTCAVKSRGSEGRSSYFCRLHEVYGIQWSRGIWNTVVTRYMEYSVTKNRDRFLNSLFFEAWMSTSSAVRGYSVFLVFFHGQVYVEGIWHMLIKLRLKAQWKSENESWESKKWRTSLTLSCLVSNKRSHILKQICSWKQQVCLSMCDCIFRSCILYYLFMCE